MKNIAFLAFLIISHISFAQRKLPYPIILIHGWTGGADTWRDFSNYLKNDVQLSVSPITLKFNLNADGNNATSNLTNDISHSSFVGIGNYDVYIIDFDYDQNSLSQSNQAAIAKQGYALSIAIREIINQAQCQRVMLLGHSMGGLAAREYLQNPIYENAISDVAKIVTIGTPHLGSNYGDVDINALKLIGKDIRSDAVRDLRTSYKNGKNGVYLYGGYENNSTIQIGLTGISEYYNLDVNCNGRSGDYITGLNQRGLVGSTEYACIIGGTNSDGVVSVESQNLKTLYPTAKIDLFYYDCRNNSTDLVCHTSEPKKAFFEMIQGLDEIRNGLAPLIIGKDLSGIFSKQSDGSAIDLDEFSTFFPQKGTLNLTATFSNGVAMTIKIKSVYGNFEQSVNLNSGYIMPINIPASGTYTISFSGNSLLGWAKYNVNTSFSTIAQITCTIPMPNLRTNLTELCEGLTADISVNEIYDTYSWRKDSKELKLTTTDYFTITEPGTYSVEVGKCGQKLISKDIIITGKPNPKPVLKLETRSDNYVLTSPEKLNTWYINGVSVGKPFEGTQFLTQTDASYAVRVWYANGCNNLSNTIVIKTETPQIKIANLKQFCAGDTVKLETDKLFSKFKWIVGRDTINTISNQLSLTKQASVSVFAYRGELRSPKSDSISFKINAIPSTPILSFSANGNLISSSPTGNQWYQNNVILSKETSQTLSSFEGGSYYVKVTQNGCSAESAKFAITANENPIFGTVKVYPNPSNGIVNISLPNDDAYSLQIIDLQGKIISTQEGKNSTQLELNLSTLNTGIYIVNLSTKNRVFNSKIIIE